MFKTRGDLVAADALLGRFLPRLGPLVKTGGRLFSRGHIRHCEERSDAAIHLAALDMA
jgi:hypothetical protein